MAHPSPTRRVANPPAKPLLLFDGACGFCKHWVANWRHVTEGLVDYGPYQDNVERFPEIPIEQMKRSVQYIDTRGEVAVGAQAVFHALANAPGKRWPLGIYRHVPGAARIAESIYYLVARNRGPFSKLTIWLWGRHNDPATTFLTQWLFVRALAVIYLVAFVSLGVQVNGLFGSDGILPIAGYLNAIAGNPPPGAAGAILEAPSLFWFGASDTALRAACWGGAAVSLLAIAGIFPGLCFLILWLLYLSFATAGQNFLGYQWDVLLLETGFLAILYAPWRFRATMDRVAPPSSIMRFMLIWLLFRLMFSSGVVKIGAHDDTWRKLTALQFHYQTQPLPHWIAWYAHQLPMWFQKISVAIMFVIELVLPFLVFAPRRPRLIAFFGFLALQVLIVMTGNYGFFNLLTIVLSLLLLDDLHLRRFFPARMCDCIFIVRRRDWRLKMRVVPIGIAALFVGFVSIPIFLHGLYRGRDVSRPVAHILGVAPVKGAVRIAREFRSVNEYGLFADMTTARPEIVIEGSDDAENWFPYEFKWKPGDPLRPPSFINPHMPRLDWQMWFEALQWQDQRDRYRDAGLPRDAYRYRQNPWFLSFLVRLMEGSEPVLALMAKNPFPEKPPRFIRASIKEYAFTDFRQRAETGAWWTTDAVDEYVPPVEFQSAP